MDFLPVLKDLPKILKGWAGLFSLALIILAGLCVTILNSASTLDQTTVRILLISCLVVIGCTLGIVGYLGAKHPRIFAGTVTVAEEFFCYYVR